MVLAQKELTAYPAQKELTAQPAQPKPLSDTQRLRALTANLRCLEELLHQQIIEDDEKIIAAANSGEPGSSGEIMQCFGRVQKTNQVLRCITGWIRDYGAVCPRGAGRDETGREEAGEVRKMEGREAEKEEAAGQVEEAVEVRGQNDFISTLTLNF